MPYPLPTYSFARDGDVRRHETRFPIITRLSHLREMIRKGSQHVRVRSLISLNKAVDSLCYYDMMLLIICQNNNNKKRKKKVNNPNWK